MTGVQRIALVLGPGQVELQRTGVYRTIERGTSTWYYCTSTVARIRTDLDKENTPALAYEYTRILYSNLFYYYVYTERHTTHGSWRRRDARGRSEIEDHDIDKFNANADAAGSCCQYMQHAAVLVAIIQQLQLQTPLATAASSLFTTVSTTTKGSLRTSTST
jgi:hypothetical protein